MPFTMKVKDELLKNRPKKTKYQGHVSQRILSFQLPPNSTRYFNNSVITLADIASHDTQYSSGTVTKQSVSEAG